MTEEDYKQLCAKSDQLLLTPEATIERIAIAWLHVLNEHPSNLAKYSDMIAGLPPKRGVTLKAALIQLRQWVRGRKSSGAATEAATHVDVMFISHLLNETQVGATEDFYFGSAPEALMEQGASACVVLLNHTKLAATGLEARWAVQMARRIVLPETLCFRQEFRLRREMAAESRSLGTGGGGGHTEMDERIRTEARRQTLSTSSLSTLRLYYQILDLVTRLRPKAIVVTFEGHAWERLAFAAARQALSNVICVGYHHTILFPRQHAALRPLGERFDPDAILTAGIINERRFRQAYASKPINVATMGIHRRQKETVGRNPVSNHSCLVIPDGIISEVVFLFDFALEAARQAPEISFVLRLHPMVARTELIKRYPRFGNLPSNFIFSNLSLQEDFKRTRCALYRGSNAAIYAVIAGLRPYYVYREKELAIDCLHQLQSFKKIVLTPAEFIGAAKGNFAQDHLTFKRESAEAIDYCKNYLMPLNLNVMFDILSPVLQKTNSECDK